MPEPSVTNQPAEARARDHIDTQLRLAGWHVCDRRDLTLYAAQGTAVREVIMAPGHGRADYLLYIDQRAVGARDKVNLDITWLRDESLEDLDNLPPPEVIAREIVEDLTAALAEFTAVAEALAADSPPD